MNVKKITAMLKPVLPLARNPESKALAIKAMCPIVWVGLPEGSEVFSGQGS